MLLHNFIYLELQTTNHPQENTSMKHGEDVALTVTAVGPQPLSYIWTKDGEKISDTNGEYTGTKTDTLIISSFSSLNQGSYMCIISGGQQSVESKPAALGLGTY